MEKNNSTKYWKRISILLLILVFSILFIKNIFAWWDGNYLYYQNINISTSTGTTPQNYSVEIILNSTNTGPGFNWNNECLNNASKVRIIDETDTFELDYWVKECSTSGENMTLWVKIDNNITTNGYIAKLYYGNTLSTLKSDASKTFDFYLNMSSLTIQSEGAGQDVSGNGVVLNNGREFHTWGNSWKVLSGFTSYNIKNDGSQMLELSFKTSDCGEIAAIKFDTNLVQENTANYRWCGTQTNWGIIPDKVYSGSGNWEDLNTILNDFTINHTYIHLPIDDDADASGDVYYKDIRVRKYVTNEPTFTLGNENVINTTLVSMSPQNFTSSLLTHTLNCVGATSNSTTLKNISLYGNWNGGWHLNQTQNISGTLNSTNFTITLPNISATYLWTCRAFDLNSIDDYYDENYSITIDRSKPQIIVNNPISTISDVTPNLNISFSENVTAWYNINNGVNQTLCNNCSSIDNIYLHLPEGNFFLNIFANDTYNNFNSSLNNTFTINMQTNYYDNFQDNSSLDFSNEIEYNIGNITNKKAIKYYNGIEIGYSKGNLNFFANQWGGVANLGEMDITCPGGDSSCWFETQNGTNISSLNIQNGIALYDSSTIQGFILYSQTDVHTRLSPSPHAQNGNNFVGVCYVSGQWYYDDNNGCNEPFTPVSTDILIANVTWTTSITSLTGAKSISGISNFTSKSINLTNNITSIKNISWTEFNTDINNNISVEISVDNGLNWFGILNGGNLSNISGNVLVYRVLFSGDETKQFGILDMNISWEYNITKVPQIDIISPLNQSKFISNGTFQLIYNITDNQINLSCDLYINLVLNKTINCTNNLNYLNLTLQKGYNSIRINVKDIENNSVNSTTNYFYIIFDSQSKINKTISLINTNLYQINIDVENRLNYTQNIVAIDFVNNKFNTGSFNFIYDWLNLTLGIYNGKIFGWDLTTMPLSINQINYSITNNDNDYSLLNEFIIGLD